MSKSTKSKKATKKIDTVESIVKEEEAVPIVADPAINATEGEQAPIENIIIHIPPTLTDRIKELADDLSFSFKNASLSETLPEPQPENTAFIKFHPIDSPDYLVFKTTKMEIVFKLIDFKTRSSFTTDNNFVSDKSSQLVLTNFTSDVGLSVAGTLMELFPMDIDSNQVTQFTVHREFVYFRMYRFVIRVNTEKKKQNPTKFKQLGPQMTLRLWRLTTEEDGKKFVQNFKKYIKRSNIL